MCIIFRKPANRTVHTEWLTDMYSRNKDGYGFMATKDGELYVEKHIGGTAQFIADFRRMEATYPVFFTHVRFKTHGDICECNSHPYEVLDQDGVKIYMMHNGVLSIDTKGDPSKSDTWHFVERVIKPLVAKYGIDFLFDPVIVRMLEGVVGSSKLVFMRNDGASAIVNKTNGQIIGVGDDAFWFSNTSMWGHNWGMTIDDLEKPVAASKKSQGSGGYWSSGTYRHYNRYDDDEVDYWTQRGGYNTSVVGAGGTTTAKKPAKVSSVIPLIYQKAEINLKAKEPVAGMVCGTHCYGCPISATCRNMEGNHAAHNHTEMDEDMLLVDPEGWRPRHAVIVMHRDLINGEFPDAFGGMGDEEIVEPEDIAGVATAPQSETEEAVKEVNINNGQLSLV